MVAAWDYEERREEDKKRAPGITRAFHARSEHFKRLLLVLDLSVSAFVYLVVLNIRSIDRELSFAGHIGVLCGTLVVIAVVWPIFHREYDLRRRSHLASLSIVGKTMLASFAVIAVALFLFKMEFVSRSVLVGFFVANTGVLVAIRWFLAWWYLSPARDGRENHLRLLIVGSGPRAQKLVRRMRASSDWGLEVIGYLDTNTTAFNRRSGDNVLGHVNQISKVLRASVVDEVIVAVPRKMLGDLQSIVDACQEEGVRLRFMADIYDFEAARVQLAVVDGIPLLSFEPVAQDETLLMLKRLFDLTAVVLVLPLLLPLFIAVALAIRLESPGPAVFVQERVGFQKRRFKMYKFRSMVRDAEARMSEVEHLNEASGPNFKIKNDPRLTRIGKFLRKTSIDELPQLINVLRGDMSLVGPRPMSVRDVQLFDKGIQRKRFSVRPGITCLWQISGRSGLPFAEWLRLDLQYIDNWSFGLDLKILLKTIPTVLKGKGAA